MPEFFRDLQDYRMLAFGIGMVLIMIWRPGGLLSHRDPTIRLTSATGKAEIVSHGAALTVEHLTMRFGGLIAVDDVSFIANDREITGVIGPNGAGKTTVFNCITGFYKPTVGRLALNGGRGHFLLEQMDGYRIAQRAGVARTFQNIRLFAGMTVLENLIVAQHNKLMRASGITVRGLFGLPGYRRAERAAVEKSRMWLDKVGLTAMADWDAGNLPLWRAAAARDRPRHVHRSGAALPRRAGGRPQPARIRRAQRAAALDPRRAQASASC